MGKYDYLKFFKKTKARTEHQCNHCGTVILKGAFYYAEELRDKFLHSLHRKKFCNRCYKELNNK